MRSDARPVVVDVHVCGAVAGLRGLGAAGLRPAAFGRGWVDAGLWSRHATARGVTPKETDDGNDLAAALQRLAVGDGAPVVPYPSTELGIDLVAQASRASPAAVLAPFPLDAVQRLRRKSQIGELAAEAGVAPPPGLRATASELLTSTIRTPCAVKSDGPVGALRTTQIAQTPDDLRTLLRSLPADEVVLIQPRLQGPLRCLAVVVDRGGRVVTRFEHVATSIWPVAAGSTASGRSVVADESLVASAARLLASAGYFGLAQLDYLEGPQGAVLIDVNPRYYSSLALALACGVNLPAAWHAVVVGDELPAQAPYRPGVTFRWLKADLAATAHGRPSRILRHAPAPKTGAIWDARDPLPGLLCAAATVLRGAKRQVHAVARASR